MTPSLLFVVSLALGRAARSRRAALGLSVLLGGACGAGPATPPPVVTIAPQPPAQSSAPEPKERSTMARFQYSPDTLSELAWLRRRFEDDLEGVEFGSLINELRDWVVKGGSDVFTMQSGTCEPGELYLAEDLAEPEERRELLAAQRRTPDDLDLFGLVLHFGMHVEERDGQRYRTYGSATIARRTNYGSGGTTERWVDGRWVTESGWGMGDGGTDGGVLSKVDDGAVYFDGEALWARAICSGNVKISCANGGLRYCPACTDVTLLVQASQPYGGMGHVRTMPRVQGGPTCNDPCPQVQAHPDQSRADEILSRVALWRQGEPGPGTIFRSKERCERELAARVP